METQILKIYTDNGLAENPTFHDIEIVATYDKTRMGTPKVTATLMWNTPLDKEWTLREYVVVNGERYYIRETPDSSKTNTDERYKHELIFRSERDELLGGIYFYDVVPSHAATYDRPCSNSTTVKFYGTVEEYVDRLNCALLYAGIGDSILKDKTSLTTEDTPVGDGYCAMLDPYGDYDKKETHEYTFEDKYILDVISEGYDINNIPFAFRGRRIVFGEVPHVVSHKFKYGYDNELLSISKSNANAKVINRITMLGSSENIPYYYPNETEYGHISILAPKSNKVLSVDMLEICNMSQLLSRLNADSIAVLGKYDGIDVGDAEVEVSQYSNAFGDTESFAKYPISSYIRHDSEPGHQMYVLWHIRVFFHVKRKGYVECKEIRGNIWKGNNAPPIESSDMISNVNPELLKSVEDKSQGIQSVDYTSQIKKDEDKISLGKLPTGEYYFQFSIKIPNKGGARNEPVVTYCMITNVGIEPADKQKTGYYWAVGDKKYDGIGSFGVKLTGAITDNMIGDGFGWKASDRMPFQTNLMPPKYRETLGAERFYNALNDTYTDPDTGNKYTFPNPYVEGKPSEYIHKDEKIEPTIEGVRNASGELFGEIADIAFDFDDNDSLKADATEDGDKNDSLKYEHSFFYIKLNIFNGDYGFDLFKCYSQTDAMTLQMTSGSCNGCKFKVQVEQYKDDTGLEVYHNPVQTTGANGDIVFGGYADKVKTDAAQEWQQNTQTHSIWICVQKDAETFGMIMPNQSHNFMPKIGDTFNIINIDLPQAYILAAEKRLEYAGIRFMADNNEEKFTFDINASRIFFAENPDILADIDEYSKIIVEYADTEYELYVNTFSVECKDGEPLPDIKIGLTDTIAVGDSFVKKVAEQAASMIPTPYDTGGGGGLSTKLADKRYLNKHKSDRTPYKIASDVGFEVGEFVSGGSGGIFYQDPETGKTWIEADMLKIRMKAVFEELMISKINTIRGKNMITPGGSIDISFVEEMGDGYRCYFKSKDEDKGAECQFAAGDQIICQEFNIMAGLSQDASNRYYWRLVTAVDNNGAYVDLSKADCDVGSMTPQAGDTICQLGNRNDPTRQSAIVLSTVDAFAPCVTLYSGIDSYSLDGKSVVEYGVDKTKNPPEPFFHCYGSFFFGPRNKKSYLQFEPSAGTLAFKGKLEVTSTIGDKTFEEYIQEVAPPVTQEDIEGYVNAIVDPKIEGIQNQIDGVIETWFYNGVPTLESYPASEWNTEGLKIQHLGDLYYDNDTGTAYRFSQKADKSYFWNTITDDAITKALAAAAKAQDTADSKRKTFVTQPVPPYQAGDVWVNATYAPDYSNDILRCKTAKAAGEAFAIGDWTLASKYTDDAALNQFIADYEKNIKDIQAQIDGKAETWYQAADPSAAWDTDEKKASHKGDLWYNTGDNSTWYWDGTKWVKQDVPASVFDAIDGKADIFVNKPTAGYKVNDLWFLEADYTLSGVAYKAGTLVVAKKDMGAAWSADDWVKKDRYTDDTLAQDAIDKIAGYEYLKRALKSNTVINGGLVLSSLVKLGTWTDQDGKADMTKVYAGLNGIYSNPKTPFLWGGGDIIDRYFDENGNLRDTPLTKDYATSILRMDGSGYFSKGAFSWDNVGNLNIGYGNIVLGADGSMTLASGIKLSGVTGSIDGNLQSLLNFMVGFQNLIVPVDSSFNPISYETALKDPSKVFALKATKSFYSEGGISAKGYSGASSGGAGATQLRMLTDVGISDQTLASGQVLWYDGTKWVNHVLDTGLDVSQLSNYLTANNYAKKSDIPALYGLTIQKNGTTVGTYTPNSKAVTINLSDVASASALSSHIGNATAHITSAERTKWNNAATNLSAILGADSDTIINKWQEVVAFLDTYTEADTLANLLSHKVDKIAGYGLSKNDFTDALLAKLNGIETGANKYVLPTASATVKGGIKVGSGLTIASEVLGVNLSASHIPTLAISKINGLQTALDSKLNASTFNDLFEKVKLSDGTWSIKAKYGLWTEQFLSAKGVNPDGTSSGGGGIDVDFLENYLTGENPSNTAGAYATQSWVNAQNYATQSWVSGNYQQKGNYLTSHQSLTHLLRIDGSNGTAAGVSTLINKLTEGTSDPTDNDYYVCQYAGGGTTTTSYHRRPMSALWNYIKGKGNSVWQPKGNYLTGITKTQVEAVLTGSITSHYHSRIASSGRLTMVTGTTKPTSSGITMAEVYSNGYPATYGNLIRVLGATSPGAGELLLGWTGNDANGRLYYRSLRDVGSPWSAWGTVAYLTDLAWDKITGKPTTLSGYGIADAKIVNGVITLGGNTITPLTSHQSIYALTLQAGAFSAKTYSPKSVAVTVNIPTTTSHISEGSNLYFTNARAQNALSATVTSINNKIATKLDTTTFNAFKALFEDYFTLENVNGAKCIRANYGLYSVDFISAKGKSNSSGGGGTGSSFGLYREWTTASPGANTQDALGANLGWELKDRIDRLPATSVNPYALTIQKNGTTIAAYDGSTAKTVNISDVASAATLSSHTGNTTMHITAAERTKWNKTTTDFNTLMGTDSDTVINKWQEVVNFLDTYTEADTLANLLSNKADKTTLNSYVTLGTAQTITGAKTFSNGCLLIKGSTSADMDWAHVTSHPRIRFENADSTQNLVLAFTDYDSYRSPVGLKLMSNLNSAWFEAPRIFSNSFIKVGGTSSQFLMANGSVKALSDITSAYVTALGTSGNYLTWTKNGAVNNITVPYATNADTVDGCHESSFLRYRFSTRTNGEATLWSQIGIMEYDNALPDELTGKYTYGEVISICSPNMRFDMYVNHQSSVNNDGIAYRSGWSNDKKRWLTILDTGNYSSILDSRYYTESEINAKLTNGSVTKVGTATVGASNRPIYLNAGVPTVLSANVGSATRPVYMSGGTITAGTYTFGNGSGNAPISNGTVNSNLNADMLDGFHSGSFEGRFKTTIDATSLDNNTWYPVTMGIGNSMQTRIRIEGNTSAPGSWNGRTDKYMAIVLDYTVNGSNWGWTQYRRVVHQWLVGAGAASNVVCGLGQLTNTSTEYVFVRGGAKYDFYLSRNIIPVLRTSAYTNQSQTVQPTTTQPELITRTNALVTDNVASATRLHTSRTLWGRPFDGTANVTGALTSVTDITMSGSIVGTSVLRLISGANQELHLKYGNTDTKSLVLNGTAFKPFEVANGQIGLGTATARWNNVQSVLGNFSGLVTASAGIKIGDATITWDSAAKMLKVSAGLYSLGGISAKGVGSSGSSGSGSAYNRLDAWSAYTSDKAGYVLSAGLGYDLHTRLNTAASDIASLKGGSALSVTTTGSGNAITAISKSGTVITATKGATFLTSHQSLASYYTKSETLLNFVRAGAIDSGNMNEMLNNVSFIQSVNAISNAPNGNGWYNVVQLAHRNGVSDGPGYVGQIALGMTVNHERMYYRTHRTRAWQTVARLSDLTWGNVTGKPTNFVTTDGAQTITGHKIFLSDAVDGIIIKRTSGFGAFIRYSPANQDVDTWIVGSTSDKRFAFYTSTNGTTNTERMSLSRDGKLSASAFIRKNGTAAQFLKADGSVDGNNYLTTGTASSTYVKKSGDTMTGKLIINGGAADKPLQVRGIAGHPSYGGQLYLQYGMNLPVYFGNQGGYNISADGGQYSGNAATATNADKLDGYHISNYQTGGWTTLPAYNQDSSTNYARYSHKLFVINSSTDCILRFRITTDANYPSYGEWVLRVNYSQGYGKCVSLSPAGVNKSDISLNVYVDKDYGVWVQTTAIWSNAFQFRVERGNVPSVIATVSGAPSNVMHKLVNVGSVRNDVVHGAMILQANAQSASQLLTSRTLWGQSFNGTGNVDGLLTINYKGETGLAIYRKEAGCGAFMRFYNANQSSNYYRIGMYGDGHYGIGYNSTDAISVMTSGNVGIGTTSPAQKLDVNGAIRAAGWVRTTGATGWLSETYGGGWYMGDTSWIRTYGNKNIYHNTGIMRTDGTFQVGESGKYLNVNSTGMTLGVNLNLSNGHIIQPANTGQCQLGNSNKLFWRAYLQSVWVTSGSSLNTSAPTNAALLGGGAIEMYHATPFIDFHFGNSTADYTSRIIEEASGRLAVIGTLRVSTGIYSNGYVSAKGQSTTSDERLKNILRPVYLDLHDIARAPSVEFKWKKDGVKDVGSIAQYWEKLMPQLVNIMPDGFKGLQYGKAALMGVIAVAKKTESLEQKCIRLEKRVKELEKELLKTR